MRRPAYGTDYATSLRKMLHSGSLRQMVRRRIDAGQLPCNGHQKIWAGRGSRHVCSVCGDSIPPTVNEYEVLFPAGSSEFESLFFHLACLDAWLAECRDTEDGNRAQ